MSWIEEIEEENSQGELKRIYQKINSKRGKLSNIMKVQSLMPSAMESHLELYLSMMFEDRHISREDCEIIGVVVSAINGCDYCVNHHAEALSSLWGDEKEVEQLINQLDDLDISPKKDQMIKHVKKLTKRPEKMLKEDVEALRQVGFSDGDILNINMVASYFNFINRIALGTGVDFSKEEMKGYNY